MINKNEFNAMLARKGISKQELADMLHMRRETLYRRIYDGWFYSTEVSQMIEIFGKEDVMKAIFNC